MSAFEVNITPTRNKSHQRTVEGREPTLVIMAPFSAKAIIQFEDVPVTKTAKRILNIINPSNEDIEVEVSKAIRKEFNLTIEWMEKTIEANSAVSMELVWTPLFEITCKETIQIVDNRNFRKDIIIILKSKTVKPSNKTRKFPTITSRSPTYTRSLRLKSPKNNAKKTVKSKISPAIEQNRRKTIQTVTSDSSTIAKKTNVGTFKTSPLTERNVMLENKQFSPSCILKTLDIIEKLELTPVGDVATSTINNGKNRTKISPFIASSAKENRSPLLTGNVMDIIDDFKFTPAIPKDVKLNFNDLASWPTPLCNSYDIIDTNTKFELRPRRLNTDDLNDDEMDALNFKSPKTITNKTFDIQKSMNITEELSESVDISLNEARTVAFDKTTIMPTPKSNALTMIVEEDDSFVRGNSLQKTFTKTNQTQIQDNNLKRDIQMVGSPLRKYSESLTDLSFHSTQSKLAIQGSLPNLNDMDKISSIVHNRYFNVKSNTTNTREQRDMSVIQEVSKNNLSNSSMISNADLLFNQHEILAQSSRFNINEIGINSRRSDAIADISSIETVDVKNKQCLPNNSLHSTDTSKPDSMSPTRRKRPTTLNPSSSSSSFALPNTNKQRINNNSSIDLPQQNKMKTMQSMNLVKKPLTPTKCHRPTLPIIKLYDTDLFLQTYINPDPFAATTTCDPFLASSMYLDERAVDKHQNDFKKWLNALVTVPADLDADCNIKIDVGKLFNEVRHKNLTLAPTKEQQSLSYLTQYRLESLRRNAINLFLSDEMREPCSKVAVYINKNAIRIRTDRNLHLDVVMQRYILELLFCFNPLWLRIGLEVVFGETMYLNSNADIVGISTFILNRLFRDKFLEQKYSKSYSLSAEYCEHIKKFTLQKILFLLLFLDKAKSYRIIKHNPCLFVKKSPYKEVKEILLKFSSELIANVGDITRDLKRLGYILYHKQSYLDEFDYAFNNIAVDLRDGVRLTRVMEIILLRDDMTKQLRVPAISRLQRIFNVNLALSALKDADFDLRGNITAGDIVDGHREKTLSLLWQIIYKFRSPKFHAAARLIQNWWRNIFLRVVINRRVTIKRIIRQNAAAITIQSYYRRYTSRRYFASFKLLRTTAATILQKYIRGFLARKHCKVANMAAFKIQHWYHAEKLRIQYQQNYSKLRSAVICVQRKYRSILHKRLLQRQNYQVEQAAALSIQTYWRFYYIMKKQRELYLHKRRNIMLIQQHYRAWIAMRVQRKAYLKLKDTAIMLQRYVRAKLERLKFIHFKKCVIAMQRRHRANMLMLEYHYNYLLIRRYAIKMQQRFRANITMRIEQIAYKRLQSAAIIIQRRYRAQIAMRKVKELYDCQRSSIIILQRRWRARLIARRVQIKYIELQYYVMIVQQKYRATLQMRNERSYFIRLRQATILLQQKYRARIVMRQQYDHFKRVQSAVRTIQQHFVSYRKMRVARAKYQGTREAIICIQEYMRRYFIMKRARMTFLQQRQAAILLQRQYRAQCLMRKQHSLYMKMRDAIIFVQRKYRAKLQMRTDMAVYKRQRQLIIDLQRCIKAKKLGDAVRKAVAYKKEQIVKIQRWYHGIQEMRAIRAEYEKRRQQIITIQRYYRSYLLMIDCRKSLKIKQTAIIRIQNWYRTILLTRQTQKSYQKLKVSAIIVQRKWRAIIIGRQQNLAYMQIKMKIISIQKRVRATILMRSQRTAYERLKAAAIVIQRRYRARLQMLVERNKYQSIRALIIRLQCKFRSKRLMLRQRNAYHELCRVTIKLQQRVRARNQMRIERDNYQRLKSSILVFQAGIRGYLARKRVQALMTPEMQELIKCRKAAKIIQRCWRGYLVRKTIKNKKIQRIRRKITVLNNMPTNSSNTVRFQVQEAVRLLRGRYSLTEYLNVLRKLDRLSRTVPHLLMLQSEFISTFCYGVMAQTIRSEIDKNLIEHCSRIILNLARYNSTTANTFQERGLVTIAQILLRWCDKESNIFNTLCTLIWVFAQCPNKRKIIRKFMTTAEAIYVVRETKKLVARKEKMRQNLRKPLLTLRQNVDTTFSNRALPSLEPDFGVVRNKPYIFISSVYAFDTILCKLDVSIV